MAERRVSVEISIDPNKADSGSKKVADDLNKIEKAADRAAEAIVGVGVATKSVGAASGALPEMFAPLGGRASRILPGVGAGAADSADRLAKKVGASVAAAAAGALPVMFAPLGGTATRILPGRPTPAAGAIPSPATVAQAAPLATAIGNAVAGAVTRTNRPAAGGGGGVMAMATGAIGWARGRFAAIGSAAEALQGAVSKLSGKLLVASAAATGFLAAGNPFLFNTFTGSVQLLGAKISELLIPAFISASGAIQGMAMWVGNLGEVTKSAIATILKWGGALTLATVVGVKVVGAIVAIGGAFKALGVALVANPVVLAIGAMAAAVGYLAYKLGLLDGVMDRISGRSSIYAKPLDQSGMAVQGLLNSQLGAPSPNAARARSFMSGAVDIGVQAAGPVGGVLGAIRNMFPSMTAGGQNERMMNSVIPRIEAELRRQGVDDDQIKARIDALRSAGLNLNTAEGRTRASQIAQTNVEGAGIMTGAMMQPKEFSTGADFYKDALMQSLGRGTVEQELLRTIQANTLATVNAINALIDPSGNAKAAASSLGPAGSAQHWLPLAVGS